MNENVCGHLATGNGSAFHCNKPAGHKGLHEERIQLRDSLSRTNWGDDGLAIWATKDTKRLKESGR